MPAIKKKWMKASHDSGSNVNGDAEMREDSTNVDDQIKVSAAAIVTSSTQRPVKRTLPQGPGLLRRLDGEVLEEKRKRFIPPAESKLSEWLDNNFEKRSDVTINQSLLYKHYTELCQTAASNILDVTVFNQMIKEKFGKTFGLQEGSAYKTVIKERKINDKKKSKTPGIKLKDIVLEAINHFGNPAHGVRFFSLKQYISKRYPAIHIDTKPKLLKRALEMGTYYGYVDLMKGVGMAGYYRLPGEALHPETETKETAKGETDSDENEKNAEEGKDDKKKSSPKAETTENETSKDGETDQVANKKKRASAVKKPKPWSYSKISFSSPKCLEDTFPLALTYQSAPKVAGVIRIRRYIQENYGETVTDNRWRQAVESGVKKGYWEHFSGSGITGRINLLMDDFNPTSTQIEDRICAAVIACSEPKVSSALQIKKYVSQYHTDFGVDQRPDRFKKALQRALDKKMVMQMSGLGANGSFQLLIPFTPSPNILAGDDDSEVEDDDSEDEKPTYVPRGTKSRGMPKVKTMEKVNTPAKKLKSQSLKRKPASSSSLSKGKSRKSSVSAGKGKMKQSPQSKNKAKERWNRAPSPLTDEEEEEEVEYVPAKSKSRGKPEKSATLSTPGKDKKSKQAKKQKAQSKGKTGDRLNKKSSHVTDEEEEEKESQYVPTKSINKKSSSKSPGKVTKLPEKSKSQPAKRKLSLSEEDSAVEADDEDMPEYTPRKSKSRGGGNYEQKSAGKASGKKKRR